LLISASDLRRIFAVASFTGLPRRYRRRVGFREVVREAIRRQASGLCEDSDVHVVVDANISATRLTAEIPQAADRPRKEDEMAEQEQYKRLSREELEELAGEALPEKAAMSLVNANLAIPINAAIAANVLSDGAVAYADAAQQTPIDQSNL
jgi:hypothetical protein